MANILIVHAHHESKSFTSALARAATETLTEQGHKVDFSDLYAMKFDPVSDRRNFATVRDPNFLKQQQEELYAAEHLGFAPEIEGMGCCAWEGRRSQAGARSMAEPIKGSFPGTNNSIATSC
jgi:hypothetical protein